MLSQKVVNGIAVVVVMLFVGLSLFDAASLDYELNAGWYALMTPIAAAVAGSALGVTIGKKNGNGE